MTEYDIFGYHIARVIEERGNIADVFDTEQKLVERFLTECDRVLKDANPVLLQLNECVSEVVRSLRSYRERVVRVRALLGSEGDARKVEFVELIRVVPMLRVGLRELKVECDKPGMRTILEKGFVSDLDALTKRFKPGASGGRADLSHANYSFFERFFSKADLRALVFG